MGRFCSGFFEFGKRAWKVFLIFMVSTSFCIISQTLQIQGLFSGPKHTFHSVNESWPKHVILSIENKTQCFCPYVISPSVQEMTFPSYSRKSSWWRNACTTILWPTLGATSGKSQLKILLLCRFTLLFPPLPQPVQGITFVKFTTVKMPFNEPPPESHLRYI